MGRCIQRGSPLLGHELKSLQRKTNTITRDNRFRKCSQRMNSPPLWLLNPQDRRGKTTQPTSAKPLTPLAMVGSLPHHDLARPSQTIAPTLYPHPDLFQHTVYKTIPTTNNMSRTVPGRHSTDGAMTRKECPRLLGSAYHHTKPHGLDHSLRFFLSRV